MKNLLAAAMLFVGTASADVCDIDTLSFEIFNDGNCKMLNKAMTESQGHVPEEAAYLYEGGNCNQMNGSPMWMQMTCDSAGIHQGVYLDSGCTQKYVDDWIGDASFYLEWDTCTEVFGIGYKAHTTHKY